MNTKSITTFAPTLHYVIWWAASLLTFLTFDILWCEATTFRPFTHYTTLYVVLLACAGIFSLPAAFSRRRWPQILLLSLLWILLEANLMYCRTYFISIPLESYTLAGNMAGFGGSILDSFRYADFLFPLIIIAAAIIDRKPSASTLRKKIVPAVLLLCPLLLSYAAIAGRGGFVSRIESMSRSVNDLQCITPVYSVFSSLAYDFITMNQGLTSEEKMRYESMLNQHNKLSAAYDSTPDSSAVTNVALILCESLEAWPIGLTIEGKEITPFLNSLVTDTANVYYNPNVLTQTRNGRSIDAQLLMLAGQLPPNREVFSVKHIDTDYSTLPEAMKQLRGASTYLFSSDQITTWNQGGVARAFGIDSLKMAPELLGDQIPEIALEGYMLDKELFERSIAEMQAVSSPYFAMWVTHTGHMPFDIPKSVNKLNIKLNGSSDTSLEKYIDNVNYVDGALKVIVDYLLSRPDASKTAIVITGDHEALSARRQALASAFPYVSSKQYTPLIIIGSHEHGIDNKEIGQVDIYSTLLDITGLYDEYSWRGSGLSTFDNNHPGDASAANPDLADPLFQLNKLKK